MRKHTANKTTKLFIVLLIIVIIGLTMFFVCNLLKVAYGLFFGVANSAEKIITFEELCYQNAVFEDDSGEYILSFNSTNNLAFFYAKNDPKTIMVLYCGAGLGSFWKYDYETNDRDTNYFYGSVDMRFDNNTIQMEVFEFGIDNEIIDFKDIKVLNFKRVS